MFLNITVSMNTTLDNKQISQSDTIVLPSLRIFQSCIGGIIEAANTSFLSGRSTHHNIQKWY